jgi:hypothetical protein
MQHPPSNRDVIMKTAVLALSLLILPAPLLAQARVVGPMAHNLPGQVSSTTAEPALDASMRRVSGSTVGMFTGGILGAAFGTYVGMAACSFNDDDQDKCIVRMPLYGLAGAVVVGGLGWVVGRVVGGS